MCLGWIEIGGDGPLTPALSLGEREQKADRGGATDGDQLPLPQGEGWGEGTCHHKSPTLRQHAS